MVRGFWVTGRVRVKPTAIQLGFELYECTRKSIK